MNSEIKNFHKNIMGTTSFDLKIKGMKKSQDFCVYPISETDKGQKIMIQSDTRIGLIDLKTGLGKMSKSHANGAFAPHLSLDVLTPFQIGESDLEALKKEIFGTADKDAGMSFIKTDNSGAINVLSL